VFRQPAPVPITVRCPTRFISACHSIYRCLRFTPSLSANNKSSRRGDIQEVSHTPAKATPASKMATKIFSLLDHDETRPMATAIPTVIAKRAPIVGIERVVAITTIPPNIFDPTLFFNKRKLPTRGPNIPIYVPYLNELSKKPWSVGP